jgi:hypothetical protein
MTEPSELAPSPEEAAAMLGASTTQKIPAEYLGGPTIGFEPPVPGVTETTPAAAGAAGASIALDPLSYLGMATGEEGAAAARMAREVGRDIAVPTARAAGEIKKAVTPVVSTLAEKAGKAAAAVTPGVIQSGIRGAERLAYGAADLYSAGVDTAGQTMQMIMNLGSRISPDYPLFATIAQKHGIDTKLLGDVAKFGKQSAAGLSERYDIQTNIEKQIRRYKEVLGRVAGAISNNLKKVAGDPDFSEAKIEKIGSTIRDAYHKQVNSMFRDMEVRYSKVADIIKETGEETTLNPFAKQKAKETLQIALDEAMSAPIIEMADEAQIRSNVFTIKKAIEMVENGTLEEIVPFMQAIGKKTYTPARSREVFGIDPRTDYEVLDLVYKSMSQAVIDKAKYFDTDLGRSLMAANQKQSQFFDNMKTLGRKLADPNTTGKDYYLEIMRGLDPDKAQILVDMLKGDQKALKTFQAGYLADKLQINPANEKIRQYSTMSRLMDKNESDVQSILFSGSEGRNILTDFRDLIRLAEGVDSPLANASGTTITAQSLGGTMRTGQKMFENTLKRAAVRRFLQDMEIPELIATRRANLFPEDSQIIDELITQRTLADMDRIESIRKTKQLTAKTTQVLAEKLPTQNISSEAIYSEIKDALIETGQIAGDGIINPADAREVAKKVMSVTGVMHRGMKEQGLIPKPVFIPVEERGALIEKINKSNQMNPLEKAKSLSVLNDSGMILDATKLYEASELKAVTGPQRIDTRIKQQKKDPEKNLLEKLSK